MGPLESWDHVWIGEAMLAVLMSVVSILNRGASAGLGHAR